MGAFKRLAVFVRAIASIGVVLIEEKIEDFGSRESRADLHERIRKAAERGGELALQVAELEAEVDELRFNGPTLYRDEVEALRVVNALTSHGHQKALSGLLHRCDHAPFTADELAAQVQGIADGTVKTVPWEDVFKCEHKGWDFNYGNCPDCGQEG